MKINHKIRNVKKYLTDIPISSKFVVCVVLSKGELSEKFDMVEAKEKSIYSSRLSSGIWKIGVVIGIQVYQWFRMNVIHGILLNPKMWSLNSYNYKVCLKISHILRIIGSINYEK